MDKFKFTEAERNELQDGLYKRCYIGVDGVPSIGTFGLFDRIETLISSRADVDGSSLPAPTQDGTAEEVYNTIENARKFCKSEDIKTLGLARSMVAYAAPLRAEIERLKKEAVYDNEFTDKVVSDLKLYQSELAAANQRIAELEESIIKFANEIKPK